MSAENNKDFWLALDRLIAASEMIIDRPKGSRHPRYDSIVYAVDYGYLSNTSSQDGDGIDVWRGSDPALRADAIICTVDLKKRDSEIKILLGCTESEKAEILAFHNDSEFMKGVLIRRPVQP